MRRFFVRIISLLMVCSVLISFVGCGNDKTTASDSSSITSNVVSSDVTSTDTSIEIDKEILEKYSYFPVVSEVMPIIHINTKDGLNAFATQFRREDKMAGLIDYVDATIAVTECEDEFAFSDIEAEVKVRGNYTLNYDKKPIRIKFSKKQNLLGLHNGEKYKNWVLLADWKDLSMSNNTLAFYFGNTILASDGFYCTDFRNVEVYLNGEYWGVYLLAEQQEVKDGRMSASEVEDGYLGNDIGYMFEFDSYFTEERDMPDGSGDPTFEISYGDAPYSQGGYTVKSDINDPTQLMFLENYLENVFTISYAVIQNNSYFKFNDDFSDIESADFTTAKETISNIIDLQSLVDMYIINEICCDPDIAWSSFYLSVDMSENGSKKLIFEAPWDFDSAFGIKNNFTSTEGLFAKDSKNPWLSIFANEQWFTDMVEEKWNELKEAQVFTNALKLVRLQKETYKNYYEKNYIRWSKRIEKGNGEVIKEINSYKTQGEAADYLYNWLDKRIEFLDSVWGK